MFSRLFDPLLSLIYPQECRICSAQVERAELGPACESCWAATHVFDGGEMLCSKCGAFFNRSGVSKELYCHKCDDHHFDSAVAGGIYENALSAVVHSLKSTPNVCHKASLLLIAAFENPKLASTTLIIPVPLSRRRFAERGFNQAELLAQKVSRHYRIPIDGGSIERVVHSPIHRAGMDMKARELTVRNAFVIKRPKLVAGQHILLIDDVLTSGATTSNCARVLKRSGAASVNVLTLARAVMD